MNADNETTPVDLIGGPMDGYDGISVHRQDESLSPGGHHLRDTGCRRKPIYEKVADRVYRFAGYVPDDWIDP